MVKNVEKVEGFKELKAWRVPRSWFLVLGSRFWAKGKALRVAGKYAGAFNPDGINRKINSIGQAGQARLGVFQRFNFFLNIISNSCQQTHEVLKQ